MFNEILSNTTLWVVLKTGQTKTLAQYQKIAILRWNWMVNNKETLPWENATNTIYKNQIASISKDMDVYKNTNYNPMTSYKKFLYYQPLLQLISIDSLKPLSQKEIEVIGKIDKDIQELTKEDFQEYLKQLRKEIEKVTKYVGLSSELNKQSNSKIRDHVFSDLEQINAAIELEEVIENIIFDFQDKTSPNLIQHAIDNLSDDSDVTFNNTYQSAIAVPFERSLNQMAHRYLGTADRWLELVAVNELQPPYIDNIGEKIYLDVNPVGKTLQIPVEFKNKISVNSKIEIGSSKFKKKEAVIVNNISENEMYLVIIVNKDISKYLKKELAYVKLYKPNTVKENDFILIPSTRFVQQEDKQYNKQELQRLDRALRAFGSDFKLKNDDWVVDNNDVNLTFGIGAVKQAVEEILATVKQDNKWHKTYGISESIGNKYYGFDQATALAVAIKDSVMKDKRFTFAKVNNIAYNDLGITINLTVWIPGISEGIPLSFIG